MGGGGRGEWDGLFGGYECLRGGMGLISGDIVSLEGVGKHLLRSQELPIGPRAGRLTRQNIIAGQETLFLRSWRLCIGRVMDSLVILFDFWYVYRDL